MRLYSILRCQSFQSFNELLIPNSPLFTTQSYPRKAGANVILLFYSHNNFLKKNSISLKTILCVNVKEQIAFRTAVITVFKRLQM